MTSPSWLRSLKALLRVAWAAHPRGVVSVLVLNVVSQICWIASMVGIKLLFDAAVAGDRSGVILAAVLIVGVGQLTYVFGMRQWSTSITVTERTSQRLDEQLMSIAGDLPGIEHHERPEYADHIALLRQERRRIGFAAYVVGLNLRIAVQMAGSVVLLIRLHPLLAMLPAFGALSFATQARAQRLTDAAAAATAGPSRLRRELFDLLTAAPAGKEVRVFGLREELIGRHRQVAEEIDAAMARAAWRSALLQGAGRVAFAVGYLGAVTLVLQRAVNGAATVGDLALAITLAASINSQVAQAAEEFAFLRRMIGAGHHYVWLLDYGAGLDGRPPERVTLTRPAAGVAIDRVSFRYPGTEELVLDAVSFRVPAGATVAVVGENGSGKTTLAKLLLRMYQPSGGVITLDGTDIGDFDVRAYREWVSAGFQDYCRFEFLARESVGVGDLRRSDDDAQVVAAMERAGAADVLADLPSGLGTQLGRAWDGVDLSGGQWQKVAVSRALMRPAPLLLVFDEPTAALDPFSEHQLFERVSTGPDRSTLLISHRFTTVRMADRIVVLNHGRVVEEGTHDDLAGAGGLYAELFRLQAAAYG